jgi:predicted Zn-dependent peptidase
MSARSVRLAPLVAAALCVMPLVATAAARGGFQVPAPVVRTLANGLRVAVFQDDRLPIVQVQLLVPAGSAQEPGGESGVANLTAQMLSQGTATRSPEAFAAAVEALGGSVGGSASREFTTVNGAFLAADFEGGLELLTDAMIHPLFSEERLPLVKDQMAAALLRARQTPLTLADDNLWAAVYRDHAYGRSPQGALRSLPALGITQVRAFHRDRYRPDRALLAVAGDVSPERAFKAAEDLLGSWGGRTRDWHPSPPPPPDSGWRVRIVDAPGLERAELRIGTPGPSRGAKDYEALLVASALFGAAAPDPGVQSGLTSLKDGGLFSINASAPADSVGAEVARVREALARWTAEPVSEGSLAAARRRLIGGFPLQYETLGGVIAKWMAAAFNELPGDAVAGDPERLTALSAADIHAAAARWVTPTRMVLVAVGPAVRLRPQLEAIGPVEVVSTEGLADFVEEASSATGPPTPERLAKGRALAGLAVAVHGGLERLRAIKDSNIEADVVMSAGPQQYVGQMLQVRKEPMRFQFGTTFPGIRSAQVLDGDHAWALTGDNPPQVEDLDSLAVVGLRAGFRSDLHHLLLTAADSAARVAWRGQERVDERDADVIEVIARDGERRVLFLDAASHRLVAMEQSEAGHSARRYYRDFRDVNGVLWPFSEERLLDGQRAMTLTVRRVAFNTGVKDEVFRRPSPQKRPRPRPR